MRSLSLGVAALGLTALALGCGGSSPTAPTATTPTVTPTAANPNVTGTWTGTMRSQAGSSRQVRVTFTGAYNASSYSLSGTWAFLNTSEGSDVLGLVQSNPFSVRLNASSSSPTWCSYNVTLTAAGNSMNGDYVSSVCFGRSTETGTMSLTR